MSIMNNTDRRAFLGRPAVAASGLCRPDLGQTRQCEDAMPTFIKMVQLEAPSEFLSDNFRAIALFSGIGSAVALIAASTGVQGVWP
jgi:hypothetical protein